MAELISPEGFRQDGRFVREPRRIFCSVGNLGGGRRPADGCAVFELGSTKAIAFVYGPMESRHHRQSHPYQQERGTLTCELSTASFASPGRPYQGRVDRRTTERSSWIQQTFESAVLLDQYPRSQVKLFIQILQSEGGEVAAAINAATLALADAGVPMRDFVVSCSSGMLGLKPAVDLNREEENGGGAQMLIAAWAGVKQVALLTTESKVPDDQFKQLWDVAMAGCEIIAKEMKACLSEHAAQDFSLRSSFRSGTKV